MRYGREMSSRYGTMLPGEATFPRPVDDEPDRLVETLRNCILEENMDSRPVFPDLPARLISIMSRLLMQMGTLVGMVLMFGSRGRLYTQMALIY